MVRTNSIVLELGFQLPNFQMLNANSPNDQYFNSHNLDNRHLLLMFNCAHCPFVKYIENQIFTLSKEIENIFIEKLKNYIVIFYGDNPIISENLSKLEKKQFTSTVEILKQYKKEFIYGALALLVVNILSVVIPLEVKNIIDQLQSGFSSDFVISKSFWLIFLATCMGLIRLFSRQIVFGIGRKVEVNLRQKLFDHLLIQDPEWIQKKGSGDIISRATSDVENIRRLLGFTVLSLCNIVLAYSFTIPSMFSINKTLTISALMIFPLILGIVSLFGGRMVKQRKAQQESLSKLSDLIQEDLSGISAIKIYAQENAEKKNLPSIITTIEIQR